ncbi:MAG: ABC transporter ATP-binding protein [Synergistaceae bacterium]|jgi:branched-chain amino acid transport system ATP-binding protein|nr:ABC transporter ATP-binding protein [Synergistaceae bacterium]
MTPAPDALDCIMEIRGISRAFGGLMALDDVSFKIKPGTVHGIIGPNGAGKTTLFNVITGMIPPSRGEVLMEGRPIPSVRPEILTSLGIARTFQNIRLFKEQTVLDNVMIGQHIHTPTPILSILLGGRRAAQGEAAARDEAMRALRFVDLGDKASKTVSSLPYGQQRLVELARALAAKPKVILLDEPAAGMNPTEKAHLIKLLSILKEDGYTIALIDHDMKVVMGNCDVITVLDHGKKIAEGTSESVHSHPDVVAAYLGKGRAEVADA